MVFGLTLFLALEGTALAAGVALDSARGISLKVEAVDDRTQQAIQAEVRVDCRDAGVTPLLLTDLSPRSKVSASFEESPWQRIALDSGARRRGEVVLHFRSHDPDSNEVLVKGEWVPREILMARLGQRSKGRIRDGLKKLTVQCVWRNLRCGSTSNTGCRRELDSLLGEVKRQQRKIDSISNYLDSLCNHCNNPSLFAPREVPRELYQSVLREVSPRGAKPDPHRYEDVLFSIAQATEQRVFEVARKSRYALARWAEDDSCGPPPPQPDPDPKAWHVQSLAAYRAYLDSLPKGARIDVVRYRMAFFHVLRGEPDSSLRYLREIVGLHSDSRFHSAALSHIGRHHRLAGRFDSAAIWTSRALDRTGLQTSEFPRARILSFLDSCFLHQPDPVAAARRHFERIGPRPYQDTIFQNLSNTPRDLR